MRPRRTRARRIACASAPGFRLACEIASSGWPKSAASAAVRPWKKYWTAGFVASLPWSLPGPGGRPDLVHLGLDEDDEPVVARVGVERADGGPPAIPAGYTVGPASPGGRGRDGDADVRERGRGVAASIGSVLGLDGRGPGAAGTGHPGSSGSAAGPAATPEAVDDAAAPMGFLPQGRHVHSILWGVGLLGALLVLLALLGPRFEVAAPGGSGGVRAGAYVLDRWTGRLWYCDSAARGRPAPVCVEFERAQEPRVDGS